MHDQFPIWGPATGGRYGHLVDRVRQAVLTGAGATSPALRQTIEARAAGLGGRPFVQGEEMAVPGPVARLVDRVARWAYRITDEDVDAVRQAGHTEDAVFEITASAALGAGCGRLERGLAALRGEL